MLTINGTGVTLYGAAHPIALPGDHTEQSELVPCSYQVVKWATILFLPIYPLGVYRVVRTRQTFWSIAAASYLMERVAWDWRQVLKHYAVGWSAPLVIVTMIGLQAYLQHAHPSLAMQLELPMLLAVIAAFVAAAIVLLVMLFATEPANNYTPPRPYGPADSATTLAGDPFARPAGAVTPVEWFEAEEAKPLSTSAPEPYQEDCNLPRRAMPAAPPHVQEAEIAPAYVAPPAPARVRSLAVANSVAPSPPAPSGGRRVVAVTVTLLILLLSGVTFLACAGVTYLMVAPRSYTSIGHPPRIKRQIAHDPRTAPSSGRPVSASDEISRGDRLQAEWAGQWYRARVLDVRPDGSARIRWLDWGPGFDEVVTRDRLQYP